MCIKMDNNNSKILELFLEEPEKEFHVRQISKILKKSPTTISKYLKELERENFLKSEKKLNHLCFKANSEREKFKKLKIEYNLNKIEKSGLIEYLIKFFNHPKTIILFGSYSKGENISKSDIDLFILSPIKKEASLASFEKKLKSPIQLMVKSSEEFDKMKLKNPGLLNNILNGSTIYGYLEIFK